MVLKQFQAFYLLWYTILTLPSIWTLIVFFYNWSDGSKILWILCCFNVFPFVCISRGIRWLFGCHIRKLYFNHSESKLPERFANCNCRAVTMALNIGSTNIQKWYSCCEWVHGGNGMELSNKRHEEYVERWYAGSFKLCIEHVWLFQIIFEYLLVQPNRSSRQLCSVHELDSWMWFVTAVAAQVPNVERAR